MLMNKIVITAIGKDKPGIVGAVTGVFFHHHASIEDSTMTILEGNFAMIMIVALPQKSNLHSFEKEFRILETKMGLSISVTRFKGKPRIASSPHQGKPYILSVLGSDKPGIVYRVSHLLARHKINITDLNTKVIGREGDKNVYAMVLEVEMPLPIKGEAITRELKKLGQSISVDITLKPLENLTL